MSNSMRNGSYYKLSATNIAYLLVLVVLLVAIFFDGLSYMVNQWMVAEEYSHGFLIPAISAYLIWQNKNEIAEIPFLGSWLGIGIVGLGLVLFFLGELSTLYIVVQYAFLAVLFGLSLAIFGKKVFSKIWVALSFLFFAIPLPFFIFQTLSSKLQLLSSGLGVAVIRLFGISVFQEGNVIDLGSMQLQVVEACSGLRYLFPLMSLAFMCAYFYKVAFWKRVVVFLSSVPITVLMNSFRIGVIGVTVEYFGKAAAEGFLHDFEGWFVFMACTAILVGEMWLLAAIGKDSRPFAEVFGLSAPEPMPADVQYQNRDLPKQYWAATGILFVALLGAKTLEHREEIVPQRTAFAGFPMQLGTWSGKRQNMEQQYLDVLKFEDYILVDFINGNLNYPVNYYTAYYESQRKGESIHSPRSCIPGGGWEIQSHEIVAPEGLSLAGKPLKVNRLLIQKGDDRQLVYYWFQQRGRDLTNEYAIKWYLFWDALTMNRTDGALVRFTTVSPRGEDLDKADARLREMVGLVLPELGKYVPD